MFERPAELLFRIMLATFAHVLASLDCPRVQVAVKETQFTLIDFM